MPHQLNLDLTIFNKTKQKKHETEQEYYIVNHAELWNFIQAFNLDDGSLDWPSVSSLFQGLGFRCKLTIDHIKIISRYNDKFLQIKLQQNPLKYLNVVKDDELVVQWFWQLFQTIAQIAKKELVFEILKVLLDLNIQITDQTKMIENIGYYYLQLNRQQNDIFVFQNDLERQQHLELVKKCFANLDDVILYCRQIFENYMHSKIYGFKNFQHDKSKVELLNQDSLIQPEKQNDQKSEIIKKRKNSLPAQTPGPNRFEMLFKHAIQLQDKKRNYQYMKDLNELKQCTFTPSREKANTPTKQISISPKKKQISRQRNKSVMDLRGTTNVIQRLEKAREKKASEERFWKDMPKKNFIPQKEFNFIVHKIPHPKPYIYVDVNIGLGKNQRIGLYNGDDLEEVAQNFGKAHQLNMNQRIGLQMRLEDIVSKFS